MDEPFDSPQCEHVRLVYVSAIGTFEFAEPGLEESIQEQEEQDENFDVWDALKRFSKPDGMILEWVEGGMGCGPVSCTTWVGIRLRPATT
jgi:hypothetical protein